jgi:uncharacterized membrane protein (UPF0127 family)
MKLFRSLRLAVILTPLLLAMPSSCEAQPRVVVAPAKGREVAFQVEIADTPAKREMGLQYRRELALNRGMLFLFPEERQHTFWMKNTPIPLDMIFIGRDQRVVGIVENAVPFSLDSRTVAGAPSQFVLEINGGLSRRYGFKPGDSVHFEGISMHGIE